MAKIRQLTNWEALGVIVLIAATVISAAWVVFPKTWEVAALELKSDRNDIRSELNWKRDKMLSLRQHILNVRKNGGNVDQITMDDYNDLKEEVKRLERLLQEMGLKKR